MILDDAEEDDEDEGTLARDDGTYDDATNTLICDHCYTALMEITPSGRGLTHELDASAAILRRQGLVSGADILQRQIESLPQELPLIAHDQDIVDIILGVPPVSTETIPLTTFIPPRPTKARQGFVYFAFSTEREAIKIGWSSDPINRLGNLQTGSPDQMELLHVKPGTLDDERDWHQRFAHLRLDREWFKAEGHLLEAIERDQQGNPIPADDLHRIREERNARRYAHQILREADYKAPFAEAQIRVAMATQNWISASRGSLHFILPWTDPEGVGTCVFGALEPDPSPLAGRESMGRDHVLRDHPKALGQVHSNRVPDGELREVPLDELTYMREEDFERAAAKAFDYTIPDLIADQVRDGFGRTLFHHDLLEWWRQRLEVGS